jgi:hypothetical protein
MQVSANEIWPHQQRDGSCWRAFEHYSRDHGRQGGLTDCSKVLVHVMWEDNWRGMLGYVLLISIWNGPNGSRPNIRAWHSSGWKVHAILICDLLHDTWLMCFRVFLEPMVCSCNFVETYVYTGKKSILPPLQRHGTVESPVQPCGYPLSPRPPYFSSIDWTLLRKVSLAVSFGVPFFAFHISHRARP